MVLLWRLTLNDGIQQTDFDRMTASSNVRRTRRKELLEAEQRSFTSPFHGRLKIAIGYPNSYHIAMSSLAYQWVVELAGHTQDLAVERFFFEPGMEAITMETGADLGVQDVLAWSYSFELDGVNILRTLDAAGIPRLAVERDQTFPLTVVGGPVASINPLPLSPAIDVFVLGAAELLWPDFIRLLKENPSRDDLLDHLAAKDGFFVPTRHLDGEGRPRHRVRRCEKRDFHMVQEDLVPASHIVTPHTEYAGRGLIEMSRGCPEKCRYCWVSFNYGRLRCYSKAGILRRVRQLQKTTNRVGFVATAVGDHPDLDEILETCADLGLNTAISSLRIPALRPEILRPLARCGSRSITIAPETGSEDLRRSLGKPITNQQILVALETAQSCGIPGLKIYFIVGLPNETEGDVVAIADLVRQARSIMDRAGRGKGSTVPLHVGVSVLVPKPYTPFQHVPMMDAKTSRKRVRLLSKLIRQIPNTRLSVPSYREAVWQCLLSRGTRNAFEALQIATDGASTAEVLKQHSEQVRQATLEPQGHPPLWQFIASAPQKESALSCD